MTEGKKALEGIFQSADCWTSYVTDQHQTKHPKKNEAREYIANLETERDRLREAVRLLLDCPDIADNDHKDEETHAAERFARQTFKDTQP